MYVLEPKIDSFNREAQNKWILTNKNVDEKSSVAEIAT